jgi:putative Ca2+/H+ antiporter (TMEM165/GDT1 family)
VSISVIATVFALIAVAELPDKTMIATLVMGARGRPLLVWLGASGAFFVHVTVAVAAGRFLELLPHRTVQIVVTVIFLLGAAYLLFIPEKSEEARGAREAEGELPRGDAQPGAVLAPADASGARLAAAAGAGAPIATATAWRIVAGAFGVILVGEIGDLTQLLVLNLSAHYHKPFSVFTGALAGLVFISAVAAFSGQALLRVLPLALIRRAGGVVLLGFGVYSIVDLVRG